MSRWPEVALGEVLTSTTQPERVDATGEYRLLGVRLEGAGPFLRETKLGTELSASTLSRVSAGDFIYSRLFAWRGAFGVVPAELDGCFVSNEFPTFRPTDERIDVNYLNLWFKLPHVRERVAADCTGSTPLTRNRYKEQFFLKLEMPLPPIEEQRRVVRGIEQLAAQAVAAQHVARRAMGTMRAVSRSILDASMRTSQCEVVALGEIAVSVTKGTTPKTYGFAFSAEGVPFLRAEEVGDGIVHWQQTPRFLPIEADQFMSRSRTQGGDVLVTIAGTIGRSAVVPADAPRMNVNQAVAVIRPSSRVLPEYMSMYIRSPQGRDYLGGRTVTSAVSNISLATLRRMLIPLPLLSEQREAVDRTQRLSVRVARAAGLRDGVSRTLTALVASTLERALA